MDYSQLGKNRRQCHVETFTGRFQHYCKALKIFRANLNKKKISRRPKKKFPKGRSKKKFREEISKKFFSNRPFYSTEQTNAELKILLAMQICIPYMVCTFAFLKVKCPNFEHFFKICKFSPPCWRTSVFIFCLFRDLLSSHQNMQLGRNKHFVVCSHSKVFETDSGCSMLGYPALTLNSFKISRKISLLAIFSG